MLNFSSKLVKIKTEFPPRQVHQHHQYVVVAAVLDA